MPTYYPRAMSHQQATQSLVALDVSNPSSFNLPLATSILTSLLHSLPQEKSSPIGDVIMVYLGCRHVWKAESMIEGEGMSEFLGLLFRVLVGAASGMEEDNSDAAPSRQASQQEVTVAAEADSNTLPNSVAVGILEMIGLVKGRLVDSCLGNCGLPLVSLDLLQLRSCVTLCCKGRGVGENDDSWKVPGTLPLVDAAVKDWVVHCGESQKDAGKFLKDTRELMACGYEPGGAVMRGLIRVLTREVEWRKGRHSRAGWGILGKLRPTEDKVVLYVSFLTLSMVTGDSLTTKLALAAFAEIARYDKGVVLELCKVLRHVVKEGYEGEVPGRWDGRETTKGARRTKNCAMVRGGVYALGMTIWGPDRVEGCRWLWKDVLGVFNEIVEFREETIGFAVGGEGRDKERDRKAIKIAEVASLSLGMPKPPKILVESIGSGLDHDLQGRAAQGRPRPTRRRMTVDDIVTEVILVLNRVGRKFRQELGCDLDDIFRVISSIGEWVEENAHCEGDARDKEDAYDKDAQDRDRSQVPGGIYDSTGLGFSGPPLLNDVSFPGTPPSHSLSVNSYASPSRLSPTSEISQKKTVSNQVRRGEEQSEELTTLELGTKAARACTFMQYAPPR